MSSDLSDFLDYQKLLTEKETMNLEHLQITIEPWSYSNTGDKMLKITVITNGESFDIVMFLAPSEFESTFDLVMDRAKEVIKATIKRYSQGEEIK